MRVSPEVESACSLAATEALRRRHDLLTAEHPHPVRGGKQPRILFGTQAASRPPTFVLFTTGFLDPQYRRFITRRLREIFGFEGSPINVNMRVREKRKR